VSGRHAGEQEMTSIEEDTVLGLSAALDAEDVPTFWEPWVPKVGDHVRIRVTGECPTREPIALELDGAVAVVDLVVGHGHPAINPGHRFGFALADGRLGMAAACELIPLDAQAPDASGAARAEGGVGRCAR
jgi:hypothetical protein